MSAVPVKRSLPKEIKLSSRRISLNGAMIMGVPSGCDRYALSLEVSTFSISSWLSICCH